MTNRRQITTKANRLCRMTTLVTSAGLAHARLQECALWRESWFISSLSYPNVSFTQRSDLCTEVTFHDDLVACAHKSHMRTSRSHAQPWQRRISHLLGVKTTGVTQCKQNGHVEFAQEKLRVVYVFFCPGNSVMGACGGMPTVGLYRDFWFSSRFLNFIPFKLPTFCPFI